MKLKASHSINSYPVDKTNIFKIVVNLGDDSNKPSVMIKGFNGERFTDQHGQEWILVDRVFSGSVQKKVLEGALYKKRADEIKKDWLDEINAQWDSREIAIRINKVLGGKLTGSSNTTSATYSTLKNGYTVRVAQHDAYTAASKKSDINIFLDLNKEAVYVDTGYINLTGGMTIDAILEKIIGMVVNTINE